MHITTKKFNPRRRNFLHAVSATSLSLSGALPLAAHARASDSDDPWAVAHAIIARCSQPLAFRTEDFLITEYGAVPCEVMPTTAWISFVEQATVNTPAPGSHSCYQAIVQAIATCHQAGGGRVVIPSGNWYCAGPIVLLSNVHVHLNAGAHIFFSNNPEDYAKYGAVPCGKNGNLSITRWEGNDCLNFSPMVYAYGQDNIALTGDDWTSILDGQAGVTFEGSSDCWWSWKGREKPGGGGDVSAGAVGSYIKHHPDRTEISPNPLNPALADIAPHLSAAEIKFIEGEGERKHADSNFLRALAEARVPLEKRVFGMGHFLRPHMVQFISCTNVLFQGYQVTNSPFWQHNPVNCHDMHVKHIYANSRGPNNDGFDPESCTYLLIEDSQFNTGDDCIAIDSGKGPDIQYGPAQNIVIQNCKMQSGHGALTFGSIMSAGIENVFAQDLVFENVNWKTDPVNIAIRFKCNMSRGGFLRNLHVRNISIPNGIRTTPAFYTGLPGSLIPPGTVASNAGAIITIDCGYDIVNDNVRTRPSTVSNVHISNVRAGNVAAHGGLYSSYQAIVVLGPITSDYNGPSQPAPVILPVTDITISDCDLGTPFNQAQPTYLYNVKGLNLRNVKIGDKVFNQTLLA